MKQYCIEKKRTRTVCIPKEFDICKVQIGVPVKNDEAKKVGLVRVGDIVLPSGRFGAQSRRNAYGYYYADKTKPKERRYISTNWLHPFGNTNASEVPVDMYRECYPKIEVPPIGIELKLYKNEEGHHFVLVDLTPEIRKNYMLEAINLLLEIYGFCYVFDKDIVIESSERRQRCNWEILPQGEMPSKHLKKQISRSGKRSDSFSIFRHEYIEQYKAEKVVEGVNGFKGYYAYVFSKCCVLESAVYGNATYIIPKDNWEVLSQKTKKELFDENKIIAKFDHTAKWMQNIRNEFKTLEIALK